GPGADVPHDERGAHRCRPGVGDARLYWLPACAGIRPRAPPGPSAQGARPADADDPADPACGYPPHAAGPEILCRRWPGALPVRCDLVRSEEICRRRPGARGILRTAGSAAPGGQVLAVAV